MTQDWRAIARTLPIGSKRKIVCCSSDPSTYISNGPHGIALGPCFRCQHREFEKHGERSITEILATRRAEQAIASQQTLTIPSDAIPLTEGPVAAWQWVLQGGLTPEEAYEQFGMTWHEATYRVLLPIRDDSGALKALLGRAVHGERPKYRMLSGKADEFFRTRSGKVCAVVEDVLSAIAVDRAGLPAMSILGTSITPIHAAAIADGTEHVIGWFDDDPAGDKAWRRLRARMALYPVTLSRIKTAKDPKHLHRAELRRIITEHLET